jgi:hypothetical protein
MIAFDDTVYLICELDNGSNNYAKAFRGYVISKGVKKVDYIDFNRFDGKGVKNPNLSSSIRLWLFFTPIFYLMTEKM